MKSVGEAMAIGRTFQQAFAKAMRSRELDLEVTADGDLLERLETPGADRFDLVLEAFRQGASEDEVHARTAVDRWFLRELRELALDPEAPFRGRALVPRRRHLRRRVRGRDAVLLLRLGARGVRRGPPRRQAERDDPRLGPEPDRPGDRVRLLLRARRDDRAASPAATQ